MDKLHKIQLEALLLKYRETMDSLEDRRIKWSNLALKQDARLAVLQTTLEELLVLLADQEKILD